MEDQCLVQGVVSQTVAKFQPEDLYQHIIDKSPAISQAARVLIEQSQNLKLLPLLGYLQPDKIHEIWNRIKEKPIKENFSWCIKLKHVFQPSILGEDPAYLDQLFTKSKTDYWFYILKNNASLAEEAVDQLLKIKLDFWDTIFLLKHVNRWPIDERLRNRKIQELTALIIEDKADCLVRLNCVLKLAPEIHGLYTDFTMITDTLGAVKVDRLSADSFFFLFSEELSKANFWDEEFQNELNKNFQSLLAKVRIQAIKFLWEKPKAEQFLGQELQVKIFRPEESEPFLKLEKFSGRELLLKIFRQEKNLQALIIQTITAPEPKYKDFHLLVHWITDSPSVFIPGQRTGMNRVQKKGATYFLKKTRKKLFLLDDQLGLEFADLTEDEARFYEREREREKLHSRTNYPCYSWDYNLRLKLDELDKLLELQDLKVAINQDEIKIARRIDSWEKQTPNQEVKKFFSWLKTGWGVYDFPELIAPRLTSGASAILDFLINKVKDLDQDGIDFAIEQWQELVVTDPKKLPPQKQHKLPKNLYGKFLADQLSVHDLSLISQNAPNLLPDAWISFKKNPHWQELDNLEIIMREIPRLRKEVWNIYQNIVSKDAKKILRLMAIIHGIPELQKEAAKLVTLDDWLEIIFNSFCYPLKTYEKTAISYLLSYQPTTIGLVYLLNWLNPQDLGVTPLLKIKVQAAKIIKACFFDNFLTTSKTEYRIKVKKHFYFSCLPN